MILYLMWNLFSNATGMPIVQQKAGKVVINSFIFAMSISITFLLLFVYFILEIYTLFFYQP